MGLSDKISNWIKLQVEESKTKGVVFGLSGGLDSACAAVLCQKVLGNNALGVIMPCESFSEDEKFIDILKNKFDIKTQVITLDGIYKEFVGLLPEGSDMSRANIKPRLRMITLYYLANNNNYLVVGTSNKSELTIGYFTKYGDGGADILPLGDLTKTEVRNLAAELGIHQELINRPPTAGLWQGQTDEEEMGFTYQELDEVIAAIESGNTDNFKDKELLKKIIKRKKNSLHKLLRAPVYKKDGEK